jgi:outer membrane protein OmpA-like peptidoglycan-associated protein
MADGYSWSEMRDSGTYRLPGPEHLGWWAAVAMLVSILLHVAVFLALDRMRIALRFEQARELSTSSVRTRPTEHFPMDRPEEVVPETLVVPPVDAAALLEEVDLLDALPKDQEIDIKPDILEAEYALQMQRPALEGDPTAIAMEISAGLEVESDLPELGREPEQFKPAEIGQVTVDPGAVTMNDDELAKFTEDLIKRGAGGKVEDGALDGIASLDDLLDLPPNILLGKKTLLPSDLLFEFNSSELRESAKVGLMKLALLIDRNPSLFCWIEGHTDLVGGDEFNLDLSIRRAEAVKQYLVESMRMDASKIITRGFGRYEPLIIEGTPDEQAANRRVEIRMRKNPPTEDQMKIAPKRATVIEEPPPASAAELAPPAARPVPEEVAPEVPKALLVKPRRALPVDEYEIIEDEPPAPLPRAMPVEPEDAEVPPAAIRPLPQIPKATPIKPERAEPVEP